MATPGQIMYELIYRITQPRWDDGNVPPQVARLAARAGESGRAIDLGCGTGTHSIYLAGKGCRVVGVDTSPTALQKARLKAARAGLKPEFILHDATRLDFLPGPFDIALDVGCLHGLGAADRRRYAHELTRLMRPGGTFLIWGGDRAAGFGLASGEVQNLFVPAFKLEQVEPSQIHGRQAKWYWLQRQ